VTPRYRSFGFDSARWESFVFRHDDLIISTPPKSGTTWTQMLCALLIFDTWDLPEPLSRLSPWLDQQTRPLASVTDDLEAQTHRRFIKTHTPLDGLPTDSHVTYLCVGRDLRDVSVSWNNHWSNLDRDALFALRAEAVGLDDLAEVGTPPPESFADPAERFRDWVDATGGNHHTLEGILHHLQTFWDRRAEPNVAVFHYSDLSADLPGQLRRLATVLGIDVREGRIDELAAAASFERMKGQAKNLAPNADQGHWRSIDDFFRTGSTGQWQDLLDEAGLEHYEARVGELIAPDLAAWAHHGWLGRVEPDAAPLAG